MRRDLAGLMLLVGGLAACGPSPAVPDAGLLRGRAAALAWHTLGPAQDLGGGTVSLLQPSTGLAVAAGVSGDDGSFSLYVPPTVRPATGSTWWLDVLRRRQGRLQGLRTVVQWDGTRWLSCTNGADTAAAPLAVTAATTAVAMVCQQAGLSLAQAIGQVQGTTISLPEPVGSAWPMALQQALAADLGAGRDPLRHAAAVITARSPAPPRAGDSLTLSGFGFGTTGKARLGRQDLVVRQWQDRQVTVQIPAGAVGGALRLSLADGRDLSTEPLLLDGGWSALDPLQVPRGGDAVAIGTVGETVIVAGGLDGQYAPIAAVERLQETVRSRGAGMSRARSGAGGAVLSGIFYAVGGTEATGVSAAVEGYDPAQDSWQTLPSLPVGLAQPAVAAPRGMLVVVGGDAGSALSGHIYRWTPGQAAWQTAAPSLDPPRAGATAVALADGTVVIAGGRDAQGRALAQVDRYDPVADTLTPQAPLQVARYAHAMAVIGGRLVVAGGWQDATGALASLETWAVDQAAWQPGPSLPSPRYGLAAATLGDAVWFVGGANDSEGTGGEVWRWRP
jgi:hypothetical protein